MKELQEVVSTKIHSMINDGTIESMISDKLEETMKDCIDKAMRSYGDFGKALEGKIEESLKVSSRNISLPEYNKYIQEVINESFLTILKQDAVDNIKALVGEIIEPVTKQSTFSEIMDIVKEIWGSESDGCQCGVDRIKITEEESDSGEALYVTFHHPEFDFYDVQVVLYNFKPSKDDLWHIGYIKENDKAITARPTCIAQSTNKVTDMLFKYYAMGTKFEADEVFSDIDLYDN